MDKSGTRNLHLPRHLPSAGAARRAATLSGVLGVCSLLLVAVSAVWILGLQRQYDSIARELAELQRTVRKMGTNGEDHRTQPSEAGGEEVDADVLELEPPVEQGTWAAQRVRRNQEGLPGERPPRRNNPREQNHQREHGNNTRDSNVVTRKEFRKWTHDAVQSLQNPSFHLTPWASDSDGQPLWSSSDPLTSFSNEFYELDNNYSVKVKTSGLYFLYAQLTFQSGGGNLDTYVCSFAAMARIPAIDDGKDLTTQLMHTQSTEYDMGEQLRNTLHIGGVFPLTTNSSVYVELTSSTSSRDYCSVKMNGAKTYFGGYRLFQDITTKT